MTKAQERHLALDELLPEASRHLDAVVYCRFDIRSSGALSPITLM
jgi:hypothetical protein